MNRIELKSAAKSQIKGKIGILFLITFIVSLISGIASAILQLIPMGSLAVSVIITPAFSLSLCKVYLNVVAGGKPVAGDAFEGFTDFWAAFKVTFLVSLYTFLWSLLFIIPGIVKAYSYSMSLYVLAENKGKSARECIEESKMMTEGKKMDLFVLDLSFIGWILLGIITLGIGFIWIVPYITATQTNAYNAIKPCAVTEDVAEEPVVEETVAEEVVAEEVPQETNE
ncbi:MAG: DUF975 family protein [Clostridia bacterium]|nr:DUF975 family protein [Clostridia bacterium]